MTYDGFGKKKSIFYGFLWLFMAITFELSLLNTFMAFYDCVRTLDTGRYLLPVTYCLFLKKG